MSQKASSKKTSGKKASAKKALYVNPRAEQDDKRLTLYSTLYNNHIEKCKATVEKAFNSVELKIVMKSQTNVYTLNNLHDKKVVLEKLIKALKDNDMKNRVFQEVAHNYAAIQRKLDRKKDDKAAQVSALVRALWVTKYNILEKSKELGNELNKIFKNLNIFFVPVNIHAPLFKMYKTLVTMPCKKKKVKKEDEAATNASESEITLKEPVTNNMRFFAFYTSLYKKCRDINLFCRPLPIVMREAYELTLNKTNDEFFDVNDKEKRWNGGFMKHGVPYTVKDRNAKNSSQQKQGNKGNNGNNGTAAEMKKPEKKADDTTAGMARAEKAGLDL